MRYSDSIWGFMREGYRRVSPTPPPSQFCNQLEVVSADDIVCTEDAHSYAPSCQQFLLDYRHSSYVGGVKYWWGKYVGGVLIWWIWGSEKSWWVITPPTLLPQGALYLAIFSGTWDLEPPAHPPRLRVRMCVRRPHFLKPRCVRVRRNCVRLVFQVSQHTVGHPVG